MATVQRVRRRGVVVIALEATNESSCMFYDLWKFVFITNTLTPPPHPAPNSWMKESLPRCQYCCCVGQIITIPYTQVLWAKLLVVLANYTDVQLNVQGHKSKGTPLSPPSIRSIFSHLFRLFRLCLPFHLCLRNISGNLCNFSWRQLHQMTNVQIKGILLDK